MNLPPVFLGVGIVDGFHSAVEHNLATGDVFLEVACCYLVEAHFFQLVKHRFNRLGGIALALMIRMNHIANLDGILLNAAIVDKANQRIIQIDAVFQMPGVGETAEGD